MCIRDSTPDLKFVPQLAQSWSTSPDNKTLTFKLRTDAVFHDGTPVNAAAVKANLDRARTMANKDPRAVAMVLRTWMTKDEK